MASGAPAFGELSAAICVRGVGKVCAARYEQNCGERAKSDHEYFHSQSQEFTEESQCKP
jgi:hypothetical protein